MKLLPLLLTTTLSLNLITLPARSQQPPTPTSSVATPTEKPRKEIIQSARETLQRAQKGQDPLAIHQATHNLAWQLDAKTDISGDRKESIKLYKQLLTVYPEAKFPAQAAEILRDLADCYYNEASEISDEKKKKEEMAPAIEHYKMAGQIYQKLNDTVETAKTFNKLGSTYQQAEKYQQAIAAYNISYNMLQKIGFPFWEGWTLSKLGDCYRALDDVTGNETDQALTFYQKALTGWKSTSSPQIPAYRGLNPNERKSEFTFAWKTSNKTGTSLVFDLRPGDTLNNAIVGDTQLWQALTLFKLAQTYQEIGDTPQALVFYQEVQRILPTAIQRSPVMEKFDPQYQTDIPIVLQSLLSLPLGQVYYALGSDSDAEKYQQRSQQNLTTAIQKASKQLLNKAKSVENSGITTALVPLVLSFFQQAAISSQATIGSDSIASTTISDQIYDEIMQKEPEFQKIWQELYPKLTVTPAQKQQLQPIFDFFLSYALEIKADRLAKKNQHETALSNYIEALRLRTKGRAASPFVSKLFSDVLKQELPPNDPNKPKFDQLQKGINPALATLTSPAKIYNSIGTALLKLDRFPTAIESYNQAITTAQQDSKWDVAAEAYLFLGKAYSSKKQAQSAIAHYEKAIPFWKKADNALREAETHLEIATVYRSQGNLIQAQTAIETAIDRIESESAQSKGNTNDKDNPQPVSSYTAYLNLATYLSSKQNYYDFYIDLLMDRHQKSPTTGYDLQAFRASERSHAKSLRAMLSRAQGLANQPLDTTSAIALARIPTLPEIQTQLLDDNTLLLEYALGENRSYLWVLSKQNIKSYVLPGRSQIEPRVQNLIAQINKNTSNFYSDIPSTANLEALSQTLLGPIQDQLGQKRLLIVPDESLQYLPFNALPHPITKQPLIVQHEILGLPAAATTLAFQSRPRPTKPTKRLALFADPVFDSTDDRVTTPSPLATLKEIDNIYPRLPGTQSEAEAISQLLPKDQTLFKSGFAANYAAATHAELSQYQFLHFATHGILNSQYPERSGMVLSLLNDKSELQRSLLSTANTFNLKLSADLVVLSGCNTSLGKQVKGEGLIGLTSGLMYAGSKQVVSSLWPVNDRVTADLMTAFYAGMLTEKRSPSIALRQAQIKILQNPKTASPFYWAAFGIQGT